MEICVKVKMYKKSMSISLQTYDKKGGYADFRNQYRRGRANFLMIFVKKKHWFLCDVAILGFQPDLDLGKDVRTPNSVWGIIPAEDPAIVSYF